MPDVEAPDWLYLDLRCFTCNKDMILADSRYNENNRRHIYCSAECGRTIPFSEQIMAAFKKVIELGIYYVDALDVADAILDAWTLPRKSYNRSTDLPDGIRSYQWRKRRLDELEMLINLHQLEGVA